MELYLLRHGIAEDAAPGSSDSARALTSEGKEKLRRVLKRAAAAGACPSLILSSPYRRAIETADIAADVLDYKGKVPRTEALLPNASPYDTWEEIRARRDEDSILLASHEPLMSTLGAFLLHSPALAIDMKKAALLRIDCTAFGAEPRGTLKWMLTPALVS